MARAVPQPAVPFGPPPPMPMMRTDLATPGGPGTWSGPPGPPPRPAGPSGTAVRPATVTGTTWSALPAPMPVATPAIHAARRTGWTILGLVPGLGVPGSLAWAFMVAWAASDGCSFGSTKSECTSGGFAPMAWSPLLATVLAGATVVVGIVSARTRPRIAQRAGATPE